MALELPNLDDRIFDDLVEEGRAMIPNYAPSWTNHNPSDPGITLIELLAYFTELLNFRLNRITRENKIQFLRLLQGSEKKVDDDLADAPSERVDEALRAAVLDLRKPERAVTKEDFETLARLFSADKVARAYCAPRTHLEGDGDLMRQNRAGHVSVVIIPSSELAPEDLASLLEQVRDFLSPKCLLTTRLHVVGPCYLWVSLRIKMAPKVEASFNQVSEDATGELEQYFSPLPGKGPKGEGWPFGRSLHVSEIYDVVDRVEGVDYVEEVQVLHMSTRGESDFGDETAVGIQLGIVSRVGIDSRLGPEATVGKERLVRNSGGKLISVALKPYELLRLVVEIEEIGLGQS